MKLLRSAIVASIGVCTVFSMSVMAQSTTAPNMELKVDLHNQSQDILKQTMSLAAEGKVINSGKFGLDSPKKEILQKWGKPDYQDKFTLDYSKRNVTFGLTKQSVSSVITRDPQLLALTHQKVEKSLGKPFDFDIGAGNIHESYRAGKNIIEFHWTNMTKPNGELELLSVVVKKG
ncbi:hypothetical protein J2Z48_000636 [Croceifilum oryzae]|uniref:Uncharacterized protein n=1 Tax=Croceifilum oryzae TaxID=1553429 RepID=A0AAJ1WPF2_9BACL|nr:DUF4309 domain-containing protein [Croceifilum oryzae]MDQ0416472.1 hypothetical protein [Croceifilum oryzae]